MNIEKKTMRSKIIQFLISFFRIIYPFVLRDSKCNREHIPKQINEMEYSSKAIN
jgi:hypothetical protein